MPFLVENGTGVAGANSYASVAFYRTYWSERGRDVTGQTDDSVQSYLIRATDFIEKRHGSQWRGTRSTLVQSLGFPREGVTIDGVTIDRDMLPYSLLAATAEYGFRASKYAELAPDTPVPFEREGIDGTPVSGDGIITGKSEKVGPISESVSYADPTTASNAWGMPAYPAADLLLSPLLRAGGRGRTIRA